jgi:hypothetical protein
MVFDPRTIVLINFGTYAKDKKGNYLPATKFHSLAQLPLLKGFNGFSYVHGYLAVPEKTAPIVIEDTDLASIQEVATALGGRLRVHLKCEGKGNYCKDEATTWVLPYGLEHNFEEKVRRGGPAWVNQTYPELSLFCCDPCKDEQAEIHRKRNDQRIQVMDISFMLPHQFHKYHPEKPDWNLNKKELYAKLRKIMVYLIDNPISSEIDMGRVSHEKKLINRYAANRIVTRLLQVPEEELPAHTEDYVTRGLRWSRSDTGRNSQKFLQFYETFKTP